MNNSLWTAVLVSDGVSIKVDFEVRSDYPMSLEHAQETADEFAARLAGDRYAYFASPRDES